MVEKKQMPEIKQIYVSTIEEWRAWLKENHEKENKVAVIRYKKHTGKPSPAYMDLMHEAICFGWIDTTIKRLDEERYLTRFSKRTAKSKWSNNTLRYAKELTKAGRMSEQGTKYYLEGLKKKPHDDGIPESPDVPIYLKKALNKDKVAKEKFKKFPPSYKKSLLRWLLKAKLPETREKRIKAIIKMVKENQKMMMTA
jgi:uncharacterized protein YdeI (YjbR/CyaY-like superfamily)